MLARPGGSEALFYAIDPAATELRRLELRAESSERCSDGRQLGSWTPPSAAFTARPCMLPRDAIQSPHLAGSMTARNEFIFSISRGINDFSFILSPALLSRYCLFHSALFP